VSRVDTLVDKQLAEQGADESLFGQAAIANARLAYEMFLKMKNGERFKALAAKGARVQRPLWASTSTKNPKFRDVLYVEELIGPDTVNTLPPATLEAYRDHGKTRISLMEQPERNRRVLDRLKDAGIDMKHVTDQLEQDGVRLFSESYASLLKGLDEKRQTLQVAR
jgi:transaldolase